MEGIVDRTKVNRKRLVRGLGIVLAVVAVAVAGFVIWQHAALADGRGPGGVGVGRIRDRGG